MEGGEKGGGEGDAVNVDEELKHLKEAVMGSARDAFGVEQLKKRRRKYMNIY